jgi:hypothetical protein
VEAPNGAEGVDFQQYCLESLDCAEAGCAADKLSAAFHVPLRQRREGCLRKPTAAFLGRACGGRRAALAAVEG